MSVDDTIEKRLANLEKFEACVTALMKQTVPILSKLSEELLTVSRLIQTKAKNRKEYEYGWVAHDGSSVLLHIAHSINYLIEALPLEKQRLSKEDWDTWLKNHGAEPRTSWETFKRERDIKANEQVFSIENMSAKKGKRI